jgi:hypothetical protein
MATSNEVVCLPKVIPYAGINRVRFRRSAASAALSALMGSRYVNRSARVLPD